jgi:hypothetical protein
MTAQFHAGQNVEVFFDEPYPWHWRKAKIVGMPPGGDAIFNPVYEVQFPDGSRGVFDVAHIRAAEYHGIEPPGGRLRRSSAIPQAKLVHLE